MSDLSIGRQAPIPKYIVKNVPNKKTDIAIGLLKGLENLLTFSINGKIKLVQILRIGLGVTIMVDIGQVYFGFLVQLFFYIKKIMVLMM